MQRGDVYFVSLDPTAGREQRGNRPVFIVTPAAFNRLGTVLIAPITSGGAFARTRGFAVDLAGRMAKVHGVILCNQLRTVDVDARNGRFVESAPPDVVDETLAKIATLIA